MSNLVVTVTDERKMFKSFLEVNDFFFREEDESELIQHVLDGIAKGETDIAAGRFVTLDEFKKKFPVK